MIIKYFYDALNPKSHQSYAFDLRHPRVGFLKDLEHWYLYMYV